MIDKIVRKIYEENQSQEWGDNREKLVTDEIVRKIYEEDTKEG